MPTHSGSAPSLIHGSLKLRSGLCLPCVLSAAAVTSSRRYLGHNPLNDLTFKCLIKVLLPAALSGSGKHAADRRCCSDAAFNPGRCVYWPSERTVGSGCKTNLQEVPKISRVVWQPSLFFVSKGEKSNLVEQVLQETNPFVRKTCQLLSHVFPANIGFDLSSNRQGCF